jgi:hypothetical protein
MPEIVINEASLREIVRARESLLGSLDAKRPRAWDQYGYSESVSFEQLLQAYERGGAAYGAVHRLLDKCWQEKPRIKRPDSDEETPWEAAVDALLTSMGGWQKLRDFDRRNMVGRYAGLIYRVADNMALREPLGRGGKLVDIVPVYENQLKVTAWHSDTNSPDFGTPAMWQYRMRPPPNGQDTQGRPDQWVDVHPSRVQILAEGSVGDFFDGVPLLRAGFNHLVDLEKIAGGSGESYLKNSARTLVLKFDPNASVQALADGKSGTEAADAVQAKTDRLNRNIDSSIVLQGGEASTLQTTVADPEPSFRVAANLFSASVQIPFTVLFGQQTGRLASDQDKADMIARCKSRQINELTPMLTKFITRAQAAGWIEGGGFEVCWPDLDAPSDLDKLALSEKMAAVNKTLFDSGDLAAFSAEEVRRAAGYEEGLPDAADPDLLGEGGEDPPIQGST